MCGAAEQQWYTLTRSSAHDRVTGRLRMGFSWEITVRSLLTLKLSIMERVLAQRVEILCMLHPVQPQKAMEWLTMDTPSAHQAAQDHPSPNLHSQVIVSHVVSPQPPTPGLFLCFPFPPKPRQSSCWACYQCNFSKPMSGLLPQAFLSDCRILRTCVRQKASQEREVLQGHANCSAPAF